MEGNLERVAGPQPGEPVAIVTYLNESAQLTHGEVVSATPLVVKVLGQVATKFAPLTDVMLLGKTSTPPLRARTSVQMSSVDGDATFVTFEEFAWQVEDRRKYPRVVVALPVHLRLVEEDEESLTFSEASGTTVDLSLGGAAVRMDSPVPVGTLMKFEWTSPEGQAVRALAIVLHEKGESGCYGVEFVNFLGEGQKVLEQLLKRAA